MGKGHFRLLAGLFMVSLMSCSEGNEAMRVPGISKELADYRKSILQNIVYDLHLNIPEHQAEEILGTVTIKFDLSDQNQDLILDFNASSDKIKAIEANGKAVDILWEQEHLLIPSSFLSPANEIKIDFVAGEQSLNRYEDYLYTLFVPERASTCFPLFDQPDLKARYNLSLTIPSSWKAVANGGLKSKKIENEQTIYHFNETLPISSYLFSFAVGDFKVITKEVEGRGMNMYHRETDTTKLTNNVDAIFDWHVKSINWMEEYTGIPLPFEKFDFVLIPSFQYSGMEHPGAILYNASTLLLEESATLNQQLGRGRLIAHETAHMWFGDLVTMKWFNDVWLKEVFANLMAYKIVNPEFPEINHNLQFLLAHYPSAYDVDRSMGTHPIQQPLDNLKNAGSVYGSIIYQKAPIVMRMLEQSLGEEAFREGIQEYLKKYEFDNASWDDLIAILGKNAAFNVKNWNEMWVKNSGMPIVSYMLKKYKKSENDYKLNIWSRSHQEHEVMPWDQDLEVLFGYADSTYSVPAKLLTDPHSFDLLRHPFPEYLFINAGGLGYGYFHMNKDSKAYFHENINKLEDPVLRATLWINLYEAMLRQEVAPDKLMTLAVGSIPNEGEALIAEYISGIIKIIYWNFYSADQRNTLAPRLEGLFLNMALQATTVNLKSTYFNALKSVAISENGVLILTKIYNEEMVVTGLPLAERDYTNLAYELAIREVEGYQEILQQQEKSVTNPDRKKKFKFIKPALSHDITVRDQFFESLKLPKNRENEGWVLEALAYLHHPLRAETSVKYISPSLEMLQEIQLTGDIFFPKRWLDNTLSGHSSEAADDVVRQFLYRHNDYPISLKNKLLQSSDLLFRTTEIKRKKGSTIKMQEEKKD